MEIRPFLANGSVYVTYTESLRPQNLLDLEDANLTARCSGGILEEVDSHPNMGMSGDDTTLQSGSSTPMEALGEKIENLPQASPREGQFRHSRPRLAPSPDAGGLPSTFPNRTRRREEAPELTCPLCTKWLADKASVAA